ncbi:hypothetical protein BDB01DRAFT_719540 [Pilobolus umbonatus]|nr:hypothetical protein BDB01DRAFT_719540 [Pilobolus umbonatus]
MMSMIKNLVRHEIQLHACVANISEVSFTEKHLMPVIRRVLLQDTSKYQPEDDCAKLICSHFNMVSNTDNLIRFDCTLFQMMLLDDGVYLPVAINRYFLIEHSHHLEQL